MGFKRRLASDEDEEEEEEFCPTRRRCTLPGLLNVLDGVASQEGRIVLMTSNFAERLDPALVRPGRIDKKILMAHISQASAQKMFLRMYMPDAENGFPSTDAKDSKLKDGALDELALQFSSTIPNEVFTPAQLQGYLLNHRNDPAAASAGIATWVKEEKARMDERDREVAEAKQRRLRKKLARTERQGQSQAIMVGRVVSALKEAEGVDQSSKTTAVATPTSDTPAGLESPPDQYETIEHPEN